MDANIEKQIIKMINKFQDEIELNESISESIKNLYGKTNDLRKSMDATSNAIDSIFGLFQLKEFGDDIETSLQNISKTKEILGQVKNDMINIKKTKEEFDKISKEFKKEYSRIFNTNEERKEIIESIRILVEETGKIKKETRQNAKKVESINKDIREIKSKIDKFEEENEKEEKKEVDISKDSIKKIAEELNKENKDYKVSNLSDESIMKIIEEIRDIKGGVGATKELNEPVISESSDENIVNEINGNVEKSINAVRIDVEESNKKIIKSQDEIKEQIKTLETNLTFTIENKTEEIINNKVNSIIKKILSGIAE